MPPAARSRLCSRDSAKAGVFARSAMSYIYTQHPEDTMSLFHWSLTGLNSESSFSITSFYAVGTEPRLPFYLPLAEGRIVGFIHLPRVLALSEMQTALSGI